MLTDAGATGGRPLAGVVAAAVEGGARAVVLREKHLPRDERAALAVTLAGLLRPVGGVVLVASDPTIRADGVHLAAADPFPPSATGLVGRSCHSAADVARAAAEGCAYATLSPIFPTVSKPGYGPALGPAVLADHPLPVWALGGVDASSAGACLRAGAAGVAVMGTVMRADDPAAVVAELCAAVASAAGPAQPLR
ncbi:MAG TPA: thiamine phosphate synthase [Acidimicrobiales bacterium]|nr:thiamine phosphate synthase [Acidimicrobiales bacterium]